jgi:hypothetical protein
MLSHPTHQHARPNAPKPIHPDKEQSAPQQPSWEQKSEFWHNRPLQERQTKNPKLEFPHNININTGQKGG